MRAPAAGNLPPRAGQAPSTAAPQVVETAKGETVEVLSSAPIKPVHAEDVGQRDGLVAGTAVEEPEEATTREPPPVIDRWVVTKEAVFSANGHRVRLPVGKVIDSLNYEPKRLLAQGVRMKKLEEGQDPADVLAEQYGNA